MEPCIFCRIVTSEVSSFKIYEDENYLAFLDISQFTRGHTVVIPKQHIRFVWDSEDMSGYYAVVQKIANHYRSLGYEFVDSMIFGRVVPHAHVHLVPHHGEEGDYKKALVESLGKLQKDPSRRPSLETGLAISSEFKLPTDC